MTNEAAPDRPLRADAERNRSRILEAASTAFARDGLEVPLETVADEAGVGIATLYRRFPTREDLIAACFERRLADFADAAEEALEAPDGWSGLAGYVERICAMQASDRGLMDVLTRSFPRAGALEGHRERGYAAMVRVIERALAEGSLRADFVPEDIILILLANSGVVQGMGDAAPDAWRRVVAVLLDGVRQGGSERLPDAPTPHQVVRAMRRLGRRGAAT